MAYVTLADIRGTMPQVAITATSKPNEGQVDAFITETEAYLDAVLTNLGYTTPVTDVSALKIVREIVKAGVVARTLQARDLGVRDPEQGGGAAQQRKFDRMIERLQDRKDPLMLPDASIGEQAKVGFHYARSNVNGATATELRDPDFTIDKEF